ncbi:hypothetical protein [Halocatena pleomorpha]|uniref:Pre-peptidase n=1 Tax=Halocatena pleomorpha TaxID=1785090 RepID=A0A3P3RA40_9EURY|nr:hypothetical protein [Halocatena pleomorpha]RRJ29768.1 hypothetical protein EIK79_11790 [Halocatena pleomorpha]
MVNISSFGRIEIVILLIVSLTAGGVIVTAVTTATGGSTDTGDTRSQTTVIDTSSTVSDEIDPKEVDWYAVDLNSGMGVTAQLRSDSAGAGPSVTLYGPNGVPVRSAGSGNGTASNGRAASGAVVERSGRHYVKVTAGSAQSGPVSYELSVSTTKLDRHDPNEHRSQAVSITPGSPVTGVMTGYDQEYFAVDANAGDTLSIETTANGGSIGTVTVLGPGGKQIHTASDGTVNGVQLPRAGQYTIHLDANLKPTETLNYSFTAMTNTEQTNTTDSRLTPETPVHGTTDSTGTTHTIDLTKGQGLSVALTHENRTDHSNSLSFSISDPNGAAVGVMPADSRGAYRTTPGTTTAVGGTVAKQTGTYTVSVSGEPKANYSLSVETGKLDKHDPNEQPGTATAIKANTTTAGVLAGYDQDVYAVDLQAGQTLTAASTSTGGFKSALWAAGPNTTGQSASRDLSFGGSTITGAPGGANLTFTANQTGTYLLKVVPHPTASSAPTFFKSVSYELTTTVSNDVSVLNVSTEESTTITPSTITETTNSTTIAPDDTLTAPITPPNRPTSSTGRPDQSTTERPAINVGTGALLAFGSVFAAFIGVGAVEWWRQSGGL